MSLNAKQINLLVISLILCFFILFTIHINFNNERIMYESFLVNEYKNIPYYSANDLKNIPKPEHPHLPSYQNYFNTLDPYLGFVPLDRLKTAFKYTQTFNNNSRDITWTNTSSNMGGRTRCLKFDPNDSNNNKVWAGGVTGGLWYNNDITNSSSSWIAVDDLWDNLVISCIAFDPNNANIIYVGTGEANTAIVTYRESSGRGVGIWKSTDNGQSWLLLESTEYFAYINDIEIDSNSNIYVSVVSGTYHGTQQSIPSDGLYKSENGGTSWTQVLPNIPGGITPYTPSDIEINLNGRIFIGTMKNINGNGGSHILYSDTGNIDSWNTYSDLYYEILNQEDFNVPGRVILSSSVSNPNTIYAVFGSGFINEYGFNYSYGNHIIKSTNNGEDWFLTNTPNNYDDHSWATLAWHALEIEIDPNNSNIIYIGGLDIHKSIDGGNNWEKTIKLVFNVRWRRRSICSC